jgi:predicted MFS family arabinose efflux permease
MPAAVSSPKTGIGPGLTLVLATTCAVSVANLYYAQPLLHTIASDFSAGSRQAGLIVTLSQIGYAIGLAFVVPLGDLLVRRRLVPVLLLFTAAAMAASAAAPSLLVLIGLALAVGVGAVGAQILVPLAASLADDDSRGRVVGTVMSGLLVGILLARTVSGLVAGATSWRVVYGAGAVLLVLTAALLARVLPGEMARERLSYGGLLRSTLAAFATQPLLRRRAAFGGLAFSAFSVFWTTLAFLLAGAPYRYSDTVIGLFGLVGAAGALCASAAGNVADRGHTRAASTVFAACVLASFEPIYLGRHSLSWLIVGIVILDIGVQGLQVINQSLIYQVGPTMRSRVNSSYMVSYFIGGALGSAVAASVYSSAGWLGVCVMGAVVGLVLTVGTVVDGLLPTSILPVAASA